MYILFSGADKTFAKRHIWFSILPEQSVASLDTTWRSRFPINNSETPDDVGAWTPGVQTDVAGAAGPRLAQGTQPHPTLQRHREKNSYCIKYHLRDTKIQVGRCKSKYW